MQSASCSHRAWMSPTMLRGLVLLSALSSCVLSLPVTRSQLENEDVKVMKCIVEALADVLSRQQHVPVGKDCLETLKTDDRLVTILRHRNFLKELQDIAVQGDQERAQLQKDAETPTTRSVQTTDEAADRSMLEALGGPGERSILAQRRRDESGEEAEEGGGVKRMEEESEEKRANSGEDSEEGEGKGGEKKDAPRDKSKEKRVNEEEEEEEEDKRSAHKQQEEMEEEEEEGEMKRGSRENPRRWTKRTKAAQVKRKEVPHHSKELPEEEEEQEEQEKKKKRGANHRSPEEKELQMMARRPPEERRAMEEEGSASRKSEDPEIESLAAIESELENVAQKLHELRRG